MTIDRWHALSWAAVACFMAGGAPAGSGSGECESGWSSAFGRTTFDNGVQALAVFDDGRGHAIYAGGAFTHAGGLPARRIARFDGERWEALGAGVVEGSRVFALEVYDDGAGPALIVGGYFSKVGGVEANNVARWDGRRWTALGAGMDGGVRALAVFDGFLYAAGDFSTADYLPAANIARWDGSGWSGLGEGVNDTVEALAVWDDGTGPALHAGGWFVKAGAADALFVARWDGERWAPLGSGMDGRVEALAVSDDGRGGGPALYAGGGFLTADGVPAGYIARYDGAWSDVGGGLDGVVQELAVHDDGGGPALYALGSFVKAGDAFAEHVARWDGVTWSPLGAGTDDTVYAAASFSAGGRDVLVVGGFFDEAGGVPAEHLARWDGSGWGGLDRGVTASWGDAGVVSMLAVERDLDGGPALYVGGEFQAAGGIAAESIARFDGTAWSALSEGFPGGQVRAMGIFDLGAGPALYAGGSFQPDEGGVMGDLARWDGSSWSDVGGGVFGTVDDLALFDDGSGPALYVGGAIPERLARWDGRSWSEVGGGLDGAVVALAVYEGSLYAGGYFENAGGIKVEYIARWDGSAWSEVAGGIEPTPGGYFAPVQDMVVFGGALYVGGDFDSAGGIVARNVARWDGSGWSAVGGGVLGPVLALAAGGHHLFAAGAFLEAGGTPASMLARWNGSFWSPLDSGIQHDPWTGYPKALAAFERGGGKGSLLYAAGTFDVAGGFDAQNLSAWTDCPPLEPPPFGECRYEVDLIDAPQGSTQARDINDRGDVAGYSDPGAYAHPYLWTEEGGLAEIANLPGMPGGYALALNEARHVVGQSDSHGAVHGFLFQDGTLLALPPAIPNGSSGANAINNHGLVVGWRSVGDRTYPYNAFLWTASDGFTDLGLMGGTNSTARDVNDAGAVVGYTGGPYDDVHEAFLWQDGSLTMLGLPPGGSSSAAAEAINDRGQVAVNVEFEGAGVFRPFLWERGRWTALREPPGLERCHIEDVNAAGAAVGHCRLAEGGNQWRAVMWHDGAVTVLDDVVPWDLGLRIEYARGINDAGRIAGSGVHDGRRVAVRLTPVAQAPADLTGDCRVDGDDLLVLLFEWGPGPSIADIDSDGAVGVTDLLAFLSTWTGG